MSSFVMGAPTQGTPILNSTNMSSSTTSYSTANLTCYNQTTAGTEVANVIKWYKDDSLFALTGDTGDTSVVAWWPLDNNIDDYDSTHDGTLIGDPTADHSSYKIGGGSYNFDGNDAIRITDNADFNYGSGDFTLEAWINPSTTGTTGSIICQWENNGGSDKSWCMQKSSTNHIQMYGSSSGGTNFINYAGTATLSTNKWYHVVISRSGANCTTFVNGNFDGSDTSASGTLSDSTVDPHIGAMWQEGEGSLTGIFNGRIDNVRIYKGKALSHNEVLERYRAGRANFTDSKFIMLPEYVSDGENWTCEITPVDATSTGTAKNSTTLIIDNAPTTAPTVSNSWTSPANDGNRTNINITFDWGECTGGTAPYSYHFLLSQSNPPTTEKYYGNWTNWTSDFSVEGVYYYQQYCNDSGDSFSINSTIRNLTVDWSSPTNAINYSPSTYTKLSTEWLNATLYDNIELNVYNITIYNTSNMEQLDSVQGYVSGTLDFITYNWSHAGINDGTNITWHLNYSDKNTALAIDDFDTALNAKEAKFTFDFRDNNVEIYLENNKLLVDSITMGTTKIKDRKTFTFRKGTLAKRYNFSVIIKADNVRYTPEYRKDHLVFGDGLGAGWVSLKNNDKGAIYVDGGKVKGGRRIWVYTNDLNFESIGGLNFGSDSGNYVYDGNAPVSNSIALSSTNFCDWNLTNTVTPAFTVNVTDVSGIIEVRISNATESFTEMVSGTCTYSSGDLYTCTLDSTDALYNKTGFVVYVTANDTCGNYNDVGNISMTLDVCTECGTGTSGEGYCVQFLQVDSYTGLTINYNLTVECNNPTGTEMSNVVIDPDDDFNTSTATITVPATGSASASFYNVSQRGTSDGGIITLDGASITGDITQATNPIKYFVPIDPPYAFTKDGVVDCGTSAVNTNINIPYPLTFIGSGIFPINAILEVTGFRIGGSCVTAISEQGRMVIDNG